MGYISQLFCVKIHRILLRGNIIAKLKGASTFTRWLTAYFVLLLPLLAFSQQGTIRVYGNITENNKKLPGAIVSLYANGSPLTSVTSVNGKYELSLELGVDYMVTYTKPGFITKRIEFNTKNVPADRAKNPFSDFPIDIDLFPEVPGTDIDKVLMQPIGKIAYDNTYDKVGDFVSDDAYHQSIQGLLDKIEAARKDAESKAKEIDAQYKKAISKADGEYQSKDYDNAVADYQAASALKPGEQYPKDQIATIAKNKQQAASDAQAAQAKKAADAKAAADAALKAKQQHQADSIANAKKAADAKAAADAAALKAKQQHQADSIANAKKAADAKAAADAALKAKQQHQADSIANAKKAADAKAAADAALKAKQQHQADSIANAKKAADAKAAADAALKAKQQHQADSIANAKKAADAKAAADAALKVKQQHQADSIANAKKAADAKATADAALKAKQQHQADSIANAKKAADAALKTKQQHDADSIANAKKAAAEDALKSKKQHIADSIANAKKMADSRAAADAALKAKQQHDADSIANAKKASADEALKSKKQHTADSIAAAKKAATDAALKATQQHQADSIANAKKAGDAKAAAEVALKAKHQHEADSIAAAKKAAANDALKSKKQRIADSIANAKKAADAKALADAALKAKQKHEADSIAAAKKAASEAALKSKKQRASDSIAAAKKAMADAALKAKQQHQADSIAAAKKALSDAAALKAQQKRTADSIAAAKKAAAANALSLAAKKAQQTKYDSLIKIADGAFDRKVLGKAKLAYINASKVKPDEQYPQDQIALIDKNLAAAKALALQKAQDTKYDSLIKIADAAFKAKKWDDAKSAYTGAGNVKPDQKYPKDQLAAITRMNVSTTPPHQVSAAYTVAINKATQLYVTKNYKDALTAYQQASALEPGENLPKDQIAKIKDILATQAANNQAPADTSNVKDSIAMKYPQGTTEEHIDEPGCEVTRRIVVKGNHGWIYTRKVWSWGQTYYFKGLQPITESAWNLDTQTSN